MGWQVGIAREAALQIAAFEPAFRYELIERVDAMSESPAEFLVRPTAPRYAGLYVHRYLSEVVPGVAVELLFDGFDDEPKRLVLVSIGEIGAEADQGEAS